jgi:hypothetical protein
MHLLLAAVLATTTFHGTVVDGDGRPVAGAKVTSVEWVKAGDLVTHEVTSGADGGFTIDSSYKYVELVVATPDGRIGLGRAAVDKPLRITMAPSKTASGRLLAPDGKPAVGLRVAVTVVSTGDWRTGISCFLDTEHMGAPWSTVTDADGHWELHCLPEGGRLSCLARDPRFENLLLDITTDKPLDKTLGPGATVTGHIRFDDGKPAPGVRVMAQSCDPAARAWGGDAKSGPDGRYTLTGLASSPFNLELDFDGLDDWTAAAHEKFAPARGQVTADVDFTLIHGQVIEGVVRDADTGAPLPKAPVGCYGAHRPRSGGDITRVEADDAGHFKLRVPPGKTYVYYQGGLPGYITAEASSRDVEVRADQPPAPIELRVQHGRELRGVVVDAAGTPQPGVMVSASRNGMEDDFMAEAAAVTDKDGHFLLQGLRRSGEIVVMARSADKLMTARRELQADALPAGDLRLVLQALAVRRVSGRLEDPDGKPLAQADVELVFARPRQGNGPWTSRPNLTAKTDAKGEYAFDNVPNDWMVQVRASRDGYTFVRGGNQDDNGGNLTCPPIVLEALSGQVRVHVVDAAGARAPGGTAFALGFVPPWLPASGVDGDIALRNLPARPLSVMALAGRRAVGRGQWDGHAATLTVTVAEPPLPAATGPSEAELDQAEALLREAWKIAPNATTAAQLAELDPSAALELADLMPRGRTRPGLFQAVLMASADLHPADALPFTNLARELPSDGSRARFLARLGRRLLPDHRDDAQKLYAQAVAAAGHATVEERFMAQVEVTMLAEALPAADLEAQVGALVALVKPPADNRFPGYFEDAAFRVAEQPDLVDRVLAGADAASRDRAHGRVIGALAARDPRAALAKFRLWFPGDTPLDITTQTQPEGNQRMFSDVTLGAGKLVAALAALDADAALAIARRLAEPARRALSLARIAAILPPERRAGLAAEAVQLARSTKPLVTALVARTLLEAEPKLAAAAFDEVLAAGEEPQFERSDPERMAMLLADYDPNASRWRLEQQLCGGPNTNPAYASYQRAQVADAYVAVDLPRALELARNATDGQNGARTLCRAARRLSQSPAERRASATDLDDRLVMFWRQN